VNTQWERIGLVGAYIAPLAGIITLAVLAAGLAAPRVPQLAALAPFYPAVALAFAGTGTIAHLCVVHAVNKTRRLSRDEASKLTSDLHLGFGYGAARRLFNQRHPGGDAHGRRRTTRCS
jgi:hypothetical protein